MLNKKKFLIGLTILLLIAIPITVLADSQTNDEGITLTYPGGDVACDNLITTSGVPDDGYVIYRFFYILDGSQVFLTENTHNGGGNLSVYYPIDQAPEGATEYGIFIAAFDGNGIQLGTPIGAKWNCGESEPTNTPVPPTPTNTKEPPTPTNTEVPPTPTNTKVPPTPTNTEVPPTPTNTKVPPTPTYTEVPPTPTYTKVPPTPTYTPVPPTKTPIGFAGCTPGYWRNHYASWEPTGFSTEDVFNTIFSVNYFEPDFTLGDAIWQGGGHFERAARHGAAALLNASHPDVEYPYSVAQVIAFVQAGDENSINFLETANELGCSID